MAGVAVLSRQVARLQRVLDKSVDCELGSHAAAAPPPAVGVSEGIVVYAASDASGAAEYSERQRRRITSRQNSNPFVSDFIYVFIL